tara:strand:- start:69 stop:302 length:234 start_codon:yes stop_codon:yes gene_type:complete
MSKISSDGLSQIQIIKNALDAMYDKLDTTVFIPKGKKSKNIDGDYKSFKVFESVQEEFETIAEIVSEAESWETTDVK